ncbi:hypothetical protein TNCV_3307341 [Trichonephila clavipes]|nr:hypothetical protein TNCV_3307341 [Trichonephila clavipes]
MARLWPYSGSKVMLVSPALIEPSKKPSRNESSQLKVHLTLRRIKSIISTYIDKYSAVIQTTKSFGKPWEIPILRHLERAENVARFHLTTEHDFLECTPTGLA